MHAEDPRTAAPRDERWQLRELPRREQAEGWRIVVARTHLPWAVAPAAAPATGYDAWVRRRPVGELALLDCRCDPCGGWRASPELRATDGEWVGVLMVLRGREAIEQDGRQVELRPGELAVWDSVRPARFTVLEPLRKRTLLLPRARVAALLPALERATALRLARDQPAACLFVEHVRALGRALPALPLGAATAAANAAIELLGASLAPVLPSRSALHAGLLAAVDAYIDRQLADPGLGPARIAAAHGISVRSLHALFEPRGESVSRRIRRLRLARCRVDLSRPASPLVTTVAFRWGFTDSAHFSRAFRQQYGESPRDVRERARHVA